MDVTTLAGCRGALVSACDRVELSSNHKKTRARGPQFCINKIFELAKSCIWAISKWI